MTVAASVLLADRVPPQGPLARRRWPRPPDGLQFRRASAAMQAKAEEVAAMKQSPPSCPTQEAESSPQKIPGSTGREERQWAALPGVLGCRGSLVKIRRQSFQIYDDLKIPQDNVNLMTHLKPI